MKTLPWRGAIGAAALAFALTGVPGSPAMTPAHAQSAKQETLEERIERRLRELKIDEQRQKELDKKTQEMLERHRRERNGLPPAVAAPQPVAPAPTQRVQENQLQQQLRKSRAAQAQKDAEIQRLKEEIRKLKAGETVPPPAPAAPKPATPVKQAPQGPSIAETINYLNGRCFENPRFVSGGILIRRTGSKDYHLQLNAVAISTVRASGRALYGNCTRANCFEIARDMQAAEYEGSFRFFFKENIVPDYPHNVREREKCAKAMKHLAKLHGAQGKELF